MSSDLVACLQVGCKRMELAAATLAAGCRLRIDHRRNKWLWNHCQLCCWAEHPHHDGCWRDAAALPAYGKGMGRWAQPIRPKCHSVLDFQTARSPMPWLVRVCRVAVGVYRHRPSLFHSLKPPWYWHPHVLCCSRTRASEQKPGCFLLQAHTDTREEKTRILYDMMQHYVNDTHQRNNGYDVYLQTQKFAEQSSSLWEKVEAKYLSGQKSASSASNESTFLFKDNRLYSENMDNI